MPLPDAAAAPVESTGKSRELDGSVTGEEASDGSRTTSVREAEAALAEATLEFGEVDAISASDADVLSAWA
jgi:hypothetical protein